MEQASRFRVTAFAGGVGGAKLAHGLGQCLPPGALTVVVNTGDDFRWHGLAVSPDLDTVMYTLAGLAHPVNGWGLDGDTQQMLDMLRRYGEVPWFGLGDRDMATNLLRTEALAAGRSLSEVTAWLCGALGIQNRLLPMTDDQVATVVETIEYGTLDFQEYFVRYRWQPAIRALRYEGAEQARSAPGVLDAIASASVLVICPSNPLLSAEPILRVPGIREAIERRKVPCVAVSPIIVGAALKGPAAKLMAELGYEASAAGVAAYYGSLIDGFVVDVEDRHLAIRQKVLATNIRMNAIEDRGRLAGEILEWIRIL